MIESAGIDNLSLLDAAALFIANPLILGCIAVMLFLFCHMHRNPPNWTVLTERLTQRAWSLEDAGIMVVTVVGLLLLSKTIVSFMCELGCVFNDDSYHMLVIGHSLALHVTVVIATLLLTRRRSVPWRAAFGINGISAGKTIVYTSVVYVAALPLIGLAALFYNAALHTLGVPEEPQRVIKILTETGTGLVRWPLVAIAVITAPLAEELLFRGVGLPLLAKRYGFWPSVVIMSLLFALIHMHVYSIAPLFILAVALSLAYAYSGSILVPILIHALFNAVGLAMLLLVEFTNSWS